jgi:hypothetical protein
VRQPPGEDAQRVVERKVPGEEQEQAGDDGAVEREAPAFAQAPFPSVESTGMRDPQEQTRLRTAHSILSSRPHDWQPT